MLSTQFSLTNRRAYFTDTEQLLRSQEASDPPELLTHLEYFDLIYRTLCGILFNFVPTSGHPGGSISSGRIVEALQYSTMAYDMTDPDDLRADLLSYAAGHKAMGLYAMWALRNEVLAQFDRSQLPQDVRKQLRLEDLLGFRRNPTQETKLFEEFSAKALDGHPSPLVPFVKLSTGASGVGVPSSFGLAVGARDYFGKNAPLVHVLEGEGGLTAGRTQEAMAAAATAQVNNIVLHLDWNQASIDSNRVCAEDGEPGDYVQWNPLEFGYFHDWNVIDVGDGFNFGQILAAQRYATQLHNDQPTMIVYRTTKGWRYGIEGKASHGAGHKFCSEEFYTYLRPLEEKFGVSFARPRDELNEQAVEDLFYDHLLTVRSIFEKTPALLQTLGSQLVQARERLQQHKREPQENAPQIEGVYHFDPSKVPATLRQQAGGHYTLRAALGDVMDHLNQETNGSLLFCAADLYGSTSIKNANSGFPDGFWNAVSNPRSRMLSVGGICEDAMGAMMSGISTFGRSLGAASSYGAFIGALEHVAARLHCIGQQGKNEYNDEEYNPFFLVCAHAGLKTGEDGPTHADPQPLQLLQENFPQGAVITLTPWDPNEMWPTVIAALNKRPGVIVPFVTRPSEKIFDRSELQIPDVSHAAQGVYALRTAAPDRTPYHGTVVLQGSGVMNTFVEEVLPQIDSQGLNMNVYYVSSAELFSLLPEAEQQKILPAQLYQEAMGITGFTLPTMYRWIRSEEGLRRTLHPFRGKRFLGSGKAEKVLEEAGLHGAAQWQALSEYAAWMAEQPSPIERAERR